MLNISDRTHLIYNIVDTETTQEEPNLISISINQTFRHIFDSD